jgi:5-methylcytosine-specific restriction endonuclease McrA
MQPTLPLEAFIERCKFCDHPRDGASKHFCTTCLPPLSQWANIKDYGKHYNILRSAIGVGREGQNKCRIPSTHSAYIHQPAQVIEKNCSECGTQFQSKPGGAAFCSPICRNISSLKKTEQSRLTRIQRQADKLFPISDVDLTAFSALVAEVLPKPKRMPLTCLLTQCSDCNAPTKPRGKATRCARCQFIATATRRDACFARRAYIMRAGDKDISWQTVGARDSWICHLCLKKVPQEPGTVKKPKGATVDHLIPLARDGLHVWSNVALAHRVCNTSRCADGTAQLKLVS